MFEDAVGIKKKIRNGEWVLGVGIPATTTRENLVKILDLDDYDFVSVDSQHSPLSEERLVAFCGIAGELDIFVQFRIKHTQNAYLIGNYLDLGPCGIEVPQTELDSTVEEAQQAFYYPPDGGRSYGGRARRESEGKDPEIYSTWWNSFGVLWVQIESIEATTRGHLWAERFPGVDCVSIGPTDLMFNIKSHPRHALQSVDKCIEFLGKSLQGKNMQICHRNGTSETRKKYADLGVTVFLESPKV